MLDSGAVQEEGPLNGFVCVLCLAVNYSSNYSYLILTNVLRFNFYFQLFHLVKKCYITHSVLVVVSNCSS